MSFYPRHHPSGSDELPGRAFVAFIGFFFSHQDFNLPRQQYQQCSDGSVSPRGKDFGLANGPTIQPDGDFRRRLDECRGHMAREKRQRFPRQCMRERFGFRRAAMAASKMSHLPKPRRNGG